MNIKIIPTSNRAKNRVKEHGEVMRLVQELPDRILCESLEHTWNDRYWLGWFNDNECNWEVVE